MACILKIEYITDGNAAFFNVKKNFAKTLYKAYSLFVGNIKDKFDIQ